MQRKPIRLTLVVAGVALTASACTTFSFAPPQVEIDKVITDQRPSGCRTSAPTTGTAIRKDVLGALEITNNFLRAYRCAAHEAADGRQSFQVPSFLATIAAAIGPTFGLGNDGRIGFAAGAAALDRGNSYYAPKEKAQVLDSALDGILCIKTESVGISFFDTKPAAPAAGVIAAAQAVQNAVVAAADAEGAVREERQATEQKSSLMLLQIGNLDNWKGAEGADKRAGLAGEKVRTDQNILELRAREAELGQQRSVLQIQSARLALLAASATEPSLTVSKQVPNGTIEIDVKRQYFEMVTASLFSVERILAQRFSNTGSFDAAGIAAELKQLSAEEEEADEETDAAADAPITGTAAAAGATKTFASEADKNEALVTLTLASLQPRLQQCVVRAKI